LGVVLVQVNKLNDTVRIVWKVREENVDENGKAERDDTKDL